LGAPESGVTAPLPLLKGGNGGGGAFSSHVVSCLSRSIWNKFIAAIHAPRKFRMVFYFFVIILKSTLLLNGNKHNW